VGRPSVQRSPKAAGRPALGAASLRDSLGSSTRSLAESLGREDLRRSVAPCQRANVAPCQRASFNPARSPPPTASTQRSQVPRLSFPTQQRPAQCSPRGSVASQSQGGSAQSSPRGLNSWAERWGNTSPSYPRSPASQSVSTLPRGLAGGTRPRAVSPQQPTRRTPCAPSAASQRPRAAAQAQQTSDAVESALRAVKQALQTASKVAAGPPAAQSLAFYMDGSSAAGDRSPPGSASIRFSSPDRSPVGSASVRFSRSPLAAARQSNKQKLHAVARSQSFTDSILDKLDDLRDTLATSSCSTTVGECSPRDSVFSVYSR